MSASDPAMKARNNDGIICDAWTRATCKGESDRSVISQAEPMFCIQEPIMENRPAVQKARKVSILSVLHTAKTDGRMLGAAGSGRGAGRFSGVSVGVMRALSRRGRRLSTYRSVCRKFSAPNSEIYSVFYCLLNPEFGGFRIQKKHGKTCFFAGDIRGVF